MGDSLMGSIDLTCENEQELPQIAGKLFDFAGSIKVWLFVGELGAGKTTLIKQLCKNIGVSDHVSSPTFSIINEYLAKGQKVYHFDFYRLKDLEEAINIGVSEYFESGNYCFIEWPQQVEQILPEELLLITIAGEKEGKRQLKVVKYE